MLSGNPDLANDVPLSFEGQNDRCQLNGLRSCSKNDGYFHNLLNAESGFTNRLFHFFGHGTHPRTTRSSSNGFDLALEQPIPPFTTQFPKRALEVCERHGQTTQELIYRPHA